MFEDKGIEMKINDQRKSYDFAARQNEMMLVYGFKSNYKRFRQLNGVRNTSLDNNQNTIKNDQIGQQNSDLFSN